MLLESEFFTALGSHIHRLQQGMYGLWGVAVELLVIALVVYAALRFLQGTRGERLLKSFWLILFTSFLVVRLVAEKLELDRLIFLYPYFVSAVVLTALIAFQPEIRRGLIRMGDARLFRSLSKDTERIIDPLVAAVGHFSQKKIGALIAIERDVGIEGVVEGGVRLDAEISSELLETLFWPGTALHDLGVVIRRSRIAAAACQFPIAESGEVALTLGSRHRAALGLSHDSDALVIVVSEETGAISVAVFGKLRRGFTPDTLRELLVNTLAPRDAQRAPAEEDRHVDEYVVEDETYSPAVRASASPRANVKA